jgi:SLT domain-containing protein
MTSQTSITVDGQTMIQRGYSHAREEQKQILEDKDKQQLNYLVNQPDRRDSPGSKQAGGVL